MTRRDFTEATKIQLKKDVDEAAAEDDDWWDYVADFFCDWFIDGNIENYGANIGNYHKEIVDKKDTTHAKIDEIWANVYAKDGEFRGKWQGLLTELDTVSGEYKVLADCLSPVAPDGGNMMLCRPIGDLRKYINDRMNTSVQSDRIMSDKVAELLNQERFSEGEWRKLSEAERRTRLEELLAEVQKIMGTNIEVNIDFSRITDPNTMGNYDPSTNSIGINSSYLNGANSYELLQVIFHEARHAFQWESIQDPTSHIADDAAIGAWEENWESGNYRNGTQDDTERANGIEDNYDIYLAQPLEWDAHSFAKQTSQLRGITPQFQGSWDLIP
jgi:hypothetical protein